MKAIPLFKIIIVFTGLAVLLACGSLINRSGTKVIRIGGSDTMYILGQEWAAAYMQEHPGIAVYVEAGGTARGFEKLARGEVDIAMASRVILSMEASHLADQYQMIGVSHLVAKDALSIYLNKKNPVSNLTLEQLRKIFTGKIKNWMAVSGMPAPIEVVIRPPSSGTRLYFKKHIMADANYSPKAKILTTTNAVVQYVASDTNAIGYGGISYGKSVKHCLIEGISPNINNIRTDQYPLTRYLYLYTVNNPAGELRNFIDWVIQSKGQRIVKKVGYIPLWQF
ncbi:MAG: phosphate ABC transporter substrate-binding protein PstS family protein [Caldithrix sp.]|nr:phosphate ABC transporter substrate-binding protein PstS family protein [Caldithrix sp.]